MLCFVLINSALLNCLCVWILLQNSSGHSGFRFLFEQYSVLSLCQGTVTSKSFVWGYSVCMWYCKISRVPQTFLVKELYLSSVTNMHRFLLVWYKHSYICSLLQLLFHTDKKKKRKGKAVCDCMHTCVSALYKNCNTNICLLALKNRKHYLWVIRCNGKCVLVYKHPRTHILMFVI